MLWWYLTGSTRLHHRSPNWGNKPNLLNSLTDCTERDDEMCLWLRGASSILVPPCWHLPASYHKAEQG